MRVITISGGPDPNSIRIIDADGKDITQDIQSFDLACYNDKYMKARLTYHAKVDLRVESPDVE